MAKVKKSSQLIGLQWLTSHRCRLENNTCQSRSFMLASYAFDVWFQGLPGREYI